MGVLLLAASDIDKLVLEAAGNQICWATYVQYI